MPFTATVLTMFPEAFPGPLGVSLIGTAWREKGLWSLETVDIRAFSTDTRGFLDDTPAGGGPGAVLKADVVARALDSVSGSGRPLLYMSARGRPLTQARVKEWAKADGITVLCGRFEGVDQRVLDARGFEEVSVGDAVLAGGEAAAMVVIEACVRLIPGVLGQAESLSSESFEDGLLEHPQYTRPRTFEGLEIPEVLLSGDHKKVAQWREEQRRETTRERRPDLWAAHSEKTAHAGLEPAKSQVKSAKARGEQNEQAGSPGWRASQRGGLFLRLRSSAGCSFYSPRAFALFRPLGGLSGQDQCGTRARQITGKERKSSRRIE